MDKQASDWAAPGVIGRLPPEIRNPLLTTNLWIGGLGGGMIVLLSGLGNPRFDLRHPTLLLLMTLHLVVISMAVWRTGPYLLRALALGLLSFAWGAILLAYVGPAALVALFLVFCALLGGSLYGLRGFVVSFAGIVVLYAISAYGWSIGALPLDGSFRPDYRSPTYWALNLGTFLCGAVMIAGMVHFLLRRTAHHLVEEVRMAESLAREQRLRAEAELAGLRVEVARHQAESTLAAMLRAAPVGIALIKRERFVLVNDRLCEMFGYDSAALRALPVPALFANPESAAAFDREVSGHLAAGRLVAVECPARTREGVVLWLSVTAARLDPGASEGGVVATFADITDARRSAALLREREERLREIFDHTSEVIFSVLVEGDGRFVIERVNRAVAGYGIDLSRVNTGTLKLAELFPTEAAERLARDLAECVRSRAPVRTQRSLDLPAGRFHFATTLVPVLAADGIRVVRVVGLARDVSAERRMVELEQARAAADAANRAKSAFLSHMSHEIRTPLNAILGFARLLRREARAEPAWRDSLEVIHRNGEHLLHLLNDILEISTIEAGRVALRETTFLLADFLEGLRAMFGASAAAKQLDLRLLVAPGCPVSIVADQGKLRQILVNLLENALKFTVDGSVEVRVSPRVVSGRSGLLIEVVDTGAGIRAEDLPGLFAPFEQTEAGRQAGGTGLGLAISRSFARLMGGDLTAASRPGEGSTFALMLPFGLVAAKGAGGSVSTAVHSRPRRLRPQEEEEMRILIVDDLADNRAVLARFLEAAGFSARSAANGSEAIAVARAWRPRAVFLDMRMPDGDTASVVGQLRAVVAPEKVAIVGLSASVLLEEQSLFQSAGIDAFLPKPFREDDVLDCLARLLGVEYEEEVRIADLESGAAVARGPLDAGLRRALLAAADESDIVALRRLVAQARERDASVGAVLHACLQEFDYDGLRAMLKEERGP